MSKSNAQRKWTEFSQERIDEEMERIREEMLDPDEIRAGEDCGRWRNGGLGRHCAFAGTEFCDFDCPYRNGLNG